MAMTEGKSQIPWHRYRPIHCIRSLTPQHKPHSTVIAEKKLLILVLRSVAGVGLLQMVGFLVFVQSISAVICDRSTRRWLCYLDSLLCLANCPISLLEKGREAAGRVCKLYQAVLCIISLVSLIVFHWHFQSLAKLKIHHSDDFIPNYETCCKGP